MLQLHTLIERWPLLSPFSISSYTYTESQLLTARLSDASGATGQGEGEPHGWDAEVSLRMLAENGLADGSSSTPSWLDGLTRANILQRLPRSPVRNAIDCALWDFECKSRGVRAATLAGTSFEPITVMPTLSLDAPAAMASAAQAHRGSRWLKIKVGSRDGQDGERMEAVAAAVPGTQLLVDVNCGWAPLDLARLLPLAQRLGVRVIEQPMDPRFNAQMPPRPDDLIFCADESCLDRRSLPAVRERFQCINIKLDKAGGLTEALALRAQAESEGLEVMVGMMSGSSLAVAPAALLAQGLELVDLEVGYMTRDREAPLAIQNNVLAPPTAALWG